GPGNTEDGLLISDLHVAPDEEVQQLPGAPKLGPVNGDPAAARLDHKFSVIPLLRFWRWRGRRGRLDIAHGDRHGVISSIGKLRGAGWAVMPSRILSANRGGFPTSVGTTVRE